MTYFYTTNPAVPEFEFDGLISDKADLRFTATKYPIESQGNVTNHVVKEPRTWSVQGIVVSVMLVGVPDPQRLQTKKDALESLALRRDEAMMVTDTDVAPVVFTSVRAEHGKGDGESLRLSAEVQEIEKTTYAATNVPPSKLKPKIKRRMGNNPKGGVTKGTAPTGKTEKKLVSMGKNLSKGKNPFAGRF